MGESALARWGKDEQIVVDFVNDAVAFANGDGEVAPPQVYEVGHTRAEVAVHTGQVLLGAEQGTSVYRDPFEKNPEFEPNFYLG